MNQGSRTLVEGFTASVERFPDRPALEVEKRSYTYRELKEIASSYAAALDACATAEGPPLTAIFALRSLPMFAGIAAALLRGHGYVPLGRAYPPDRNESMLRQTGCRSVIVDRDSAGQVPAVFKSIEYPVTILLPELDDVSAIAEALPRHTVLGARDIVLAPAYAPKTPSPDSIAYIIFTSGSTGTPKGVMIANRNIRAFIGFFAEHYHINEHDRFSHAFAITFDGSVIDLFSSWLRGACVCCPSQRDLLNPSGFIRKHNLTLWFSIPSLAFFMKRLGSLKKGNFPTLRWSMFGAEPLSEDIVHSWLKAAPNSEIDNAYGPTEATCAVTTYHWDPVVSPREVHLGMVPIGYPNPGTEVLICDDRLHEVPPGGRGELLVAGPQVSLGYLNDPERTKEAFVVPPGKKEIYYRTGDLVQRLVGEGPILYLGRIDHQIKVLGHRVELGEVEAVVREETGVYGVVALGWPMTPSGAQGIEVFIEDKELDVAGLKGRIALRLPEFMAPKKYHLIAKIPVNDSGKHDRLALQEILEADA